MYHSSQFFEVFSLLTIVIIENNNTTPDNYQVTFFHVRCNLFESDDS